MNDSNNKKQLMKLTMIKKAIIWTLGIIVGLLTICWGIYIIRQQQSYQSVVHKDSKALLTISLDDILLNQFLYRWETAPKAGKDFVKELNKLKDNGIDIKANVFLFSLEDSRKNFYAFFDLKNQEQFLGFLTDALTVDSIERDVLPGISYAYVKQYKVAFVWKENDLLVGLGVDPTEKKKEMLQMIQSAEDRVAVKKFIAHPNRLTHKAARYTDMVTDNFIEFDLKGSHIDIIGEFRSSAWHFPKKYLIRDLADHDYIIKGWINFPDLHLKNTIKKSLIHFPVAADSIMAHASGNYVDLEMLKTQALQTDTIINYAVDENFETVEEKTPYVNKVPTIRIGIRGDKDLHKFLPSKFFYQWFHRQEGTFDLISTDSSVNQLKSKYRNTDDLLHVAIHLADWPVDIKLPSILMLKSVASHLDINVKSVDSNRLIIRGIISDYSR